MIGQRFLTFNIASMLLAGLLLSGCIGRNNTEVTYYSLMTMEQSGENLQLGEYPELALGVGPVAIPESLKRSQIVTRNSLNQYSFNEFNRWAGVLENDIATVLGDNLGELLGVKKVAFFPWKYQFSPDYRVTLDIQRFDGALDGDVVFSVRWIVSDGEGKKTLAMQKSTYRQALEEASFPALIKAESQVLAALSQDIAEVVVALKK